MPREPAQRPLALWLIRHGEAHIGHHEPPPMGPPLTLRGKLQALALAARLNRERFTAIYSSDLTRTLQTARIVSRPHREASLQVTADLREVSSHHAGVTLARITPPRPEDVSSEHDAISRFANLMRHEHVAGHKVLIFAHGNLIRALVPMIADSEPKQFPLLDVRNTSLTVIELWPSGARVLRVSNCVRHLPAWLIT